MQKLKNFVMILTSYACDKGCPYCIAKIDALPFKVDNLDLFERKIQELKEKGYGVFYLSNFFEKATNDCFHAIDFIPYMDGGIFSYQEKLIKPDPAIYQLLLERYQLKAEHCLFLDDKIENCVAARNEGIASIVFTQRQDVLEEMKRYGIE